MSRLLITGIATLDIINHVDHYPAENEEMRLCRQDINSGGNAANTAMVLAQFHHQVMFNGIFANDSEGEWLRQRLATCGIDTHLAKTASGKTPTSYITLNRQNGSRTILHYRDLPELCFADFRQVPVSEFDWLHFEGRHIPELHRILVHVNKHRIDQPLSVEIEKDRENIDTLIPLADVIMYSKSFAAQRGFDTPLAFLQAMRRINTSAIHVASWGEQGAWAEDHLGHQYHCPAFVPEKILDTLGAGDTFNAGLIHGLVSGQNLEEALTTACQLAGRKVAQTGFENLVL